jgi:predicted GH43/DUF377 family glycosyl hydrolase
MLYRAQGTRGADTRPHAPSYLGLAVFTPLLELVKRWPEPVIAPEALFHNYGVEDARCTKVGDTYYLYYTGFTSEGAIDPAHPGRTQICLATTQNFLDWTLHGASEGGVNAVYNKNCALLPEPVDGQYILLHRPMMGFRPMAMHWATAPAPEGPWTSQGLLMASYRYEEFAASWIGAGGPPETIGDGRFVGIYHQGHYSWERRREYDLAAFLLDFTDADAPVRARIEPLMRPQGAREQVGDPELGVDNVLFSCANYRFRGDLVIPYAAADSRIFGARISFEALREALEARAEEPARAAA